MEWCLVLTLYYTYYTPLHWQLYIFYTTLGGKHRINSTGSSLYAIAIHQCELYIILYTYISYTYAIHHCELYIRYTGLGSLPVFGAWPQNIENTLGLYILYYAILNYTYPRTIHSLLYYTKLYIPAEDYLPVHLWRSSLGGAVPALCCTVQ